MATLQSTRVAAGLPPRTPHDEGVTEVVGVYQFAANPAANDVVQMVAVPKGAVIIQVILSADRLDTNATPTMTFQVGDRNTANLYIATTTAAALAGTAAGPPVQLNNCAGHGYTYPTDSTIDVKVIANAATFAAGQIRLAVRYTLQP